MNITLLNKDATNTIVENAKAIVDVDTLPVSPDSKLIYRCPIVSGYRKQRMDLTQAAKGEGMTISSAGLANSGGDTVSWSQVQSYWDTDPVRYSQYFEARDNGDLRVYTKISDSTVSLLYGSDMDADAWSLNAYKDGWSEIYNSGLSYLPLSGGTMTGELNMGNNIIRGIATPTASQNAANKAYVDNALSNYLPLSGGTMSGSIGFSGTSNVLKNSGDSLRWAGNDICTYSAATVEFANYSGTATKTSGTFTVTSANKIAPKAFKINIKFALSAAVSAETEYALPKYISTLDGSALEDYQAIAGVSAVNTSPVGVLVRKNVIYINATNAIASGKYIYISGVLAI